MEGCGCGCGLWWRRRSPREGVNQVTRPVREALGAVPLIGVADREAVGAVTRITVKEEFGDVLWTPVVESGRVAIWIVVELLVVIWNAFDGLLEIPNSVEAILAV